MESFESFDFLSFLTHQYATPIQRVTPSGRLQHGALILLPDAVALCSPRGGLNQYLPFSTLQSITNFVQFGAVCLHTSSASSRDMLIVSAQFTPKRLQDIPNSNNNNNPTTAPVVPSNNGPCQNSDRCLSTFLTHLSELLLARNGVSMTIQMDWNNAPKCEKLSLAPPRKGPPPPLPSSTAPEFSALRGQQGRPQMAGGNSSLAEEVEGAPAAVYGSPVPKRLLTALASAAAAARVRRSQLLSAVVHGTPLAPLPATGAPGVARKQQQQHLDPTTTTATTTLAFPNQQGGGAEAGGGGGGEPPLTLSDTARRGADEDGDRLTILLLTRYHHHPSSSFASTPSLHVSGTSTGAGGGGAGGGESGALSNGISFDPQRQQSVLTVPTVKRLWTYLQHVAANVPELVPESFVASQSLHSPGTHSSAASVAGGGAPQYGKFSSCMLPNSANRSAMTTAGGLGAGDGEGARTSSSSSPFPVGNHKLATAGSATKRAPIVLQTDLLTKLNWRTVFSPPQAPPSPPASTPAGAATAPREETTRAPTSSSTAAAAAAGTASTVPLLDRFVSIASIENPSAVIVLRLRFVLSVLELFAESQPHVVTVESFGQRHQVAGASLWAGAAANI